jgi:hypothetical protein
MIILQKISLPLWLVGRIGHLVRHFQLLLNLTVGEFWLAGAGDREKRLIYCLHRKNRVENCQWNCGKDGCCPCHRNIFVLKIVEIVVDDELPHCKGD